MRRRRVPAFARRRRFWATIATLSVVIVALVSFVASQGRAEAATRTATRATAAIHAARTAEASRWATDELAAAEESLRLAEIERRRQDVGGGRWAPLAERHDPASDHHSPPAEV